MTSNDKPRVSGNDHGFWRRLKSIEIKNVIAQDKQIKDLEKEALKFARDEANKKIIDNLKNEPKFEKQEEK